MSVVELRRYRLAVSRPSRIPKTVADCFKYRNKLGIDVATEALREAVREKNVSPDELLRFADICRVRSVVVPYLESVVH